MVLSSPLTATADQIRKDQWPLLAFSAEEVWNESTGKGGTVALVDQGVNGDHPDLKGNVLPGESLATGGRGDKETEFDHGTAMASIIAGHGHGQQGDNGVKGLAPDAKILPIGMYADAATEEPASGYLVNALHYAVEKGAKVVNMSFGHLTLERREKDAIAHALRNDVVSVTSSGNEGDDELDQLGEHPGDSPNRHYE